MAVLECGSSSYRLSVSSSELWPHEPKAEGGSCCYRTPRKRAKRSFSLILTPMTVGPPRPDRQTRSVARTAGKIDSARELRRTPTETERAAGYLLCGLRLKGGKRRRVEHVRF